MNGEKNNGDSRFRQSFTMRAEAGQGYWSHPPTQITPGVSRRGPFGTISRDDLLPGTSSTRVSRTAKFNPMNNTTIAPMLSRSKEPPDERAPKRPRLSEPSENFRKAPNRQLVPPLVGTSTPDLPRPSTSRGADRRKQVPDGNDSDDPIDLLNQDSQRRGSDAPATSQHNGVSRGRPEREEVYRAEVVNSRNSNRPVNRQGTPSGTTPFNSILPRRAKFEEDMPDPRALPHFDMKTFKTQKKSRIAAMKGQDGKERSDLKSGKLRQYGLPITFTGAGDPLSQPSLSPKRRLKLEREKIPETDSPILKRSIEAMFIEWNPHHDMTDACLLFDEQGRHLILQFSGMEVIFANHDIKWSKTDYLTHVFICIKRESRAHRSLQESGLWIPKTLDNDFPSHTISLKFQHSDLKDRRIRMLFNDMEGEEAPPRKIASASIIWSQLVDAAKDKAQKLGKITMKTFDDGSDLTSPSPERDFSRPTRSAPAPARAPAPVKRATRASGVKQVDLDNDEVMLVFPFTGTGSTQITRGEHQRLHPGEYLNDTLIEFGLRDWLEKLKETNPSLAEQIHVFSPFFYKKLKNKDSQAGYDTVKKWTSKVDIFQKRYLVVPINERLHWYLAIVMYPENILRSAKPIHQETDPDVPPYEGQIQQDTIMDEVVEETPQSSLPSSRAGSPQNMHVDEDNEMKDALIPETIIIASSPEKPHRTAPSSPGFLEEELLNVPNEEDPSPPPDDSWKAFQDTTWILSFDSLGGKHPAALKTLRDYLTLEAKHKKGLELESAESIRTRTVPSPTQTNYCDCGVYVIKTVESFLGRPDEFFQRLMDTNDSLTKQHPLWNGEEFEAKREQLRERISQLSSEWMIFKGTAEAGKPPTKAVSVNGSRPPNSPTQQREALLTEEDSGDEIEIVGEVSAPKARAVRPAPSKSRRAKRLS